MEEPTLYRQSYKTLKQDVGRLIKKYLAAFQWHNDGSNILIDLGSGPGDVFMDYVYPEMPSNFHKAICSDISEDMLQSAQSYYNNPEKVVYRTLDVTTKKLPSDLKATAHQVTSTLLMHWIRDYRTAVTNMYDLIRPEGGDCLITFMPHNTIADANDAIMGSNKWSNYLQDIDGFIPTSSYSKTLKDDFCCLLEDVGFTQINTETLSGVEVFGNIEEFKDAAKSVCNLLHYIPESLQMEFLDDFVALMMDITSRDECAKQADSKYCFCYELLVCHAKKVAKKC